MKKSCLSLFAFSAMITPSISQAAEIILCTPLYKGADQVSIYLNEKIRAGKSLSCIRIMAAEGETCAHNGGISLLYPTGTGRISRTFDHPNDVYGYPGPMIKFSMSSDRITFSGGDFNGKNAWTDNWYFDLNRIDGLAFFKADKSLGIASGKYRCAKRKAVI